MGGGKSQKGGKHGFIGRTLAHDILARQAKMSESGYGSRPQRQVEQSVFERDSLEEFTLAAQEGLESYLNTHATTKEVMASDFNSQLENMINYSDVKQYKVYPVVPTPRRCLFFDDEHREIIGKLIKQREHEQYVKEKRKDKRRNKKLVDMYMRGTGPKPMHGIYDPYKTRNNSHNPTFDKYDQPYNDENSDLFSGLEEEIPEKYDSSDEEDEEEEEIEDGDAIYDYGDTTFEEGDDAIEVTTENHEDVTDDGASSGCSEADSVSNDDWESLESDDDDYDDFETDQKGAKETISSRDSVSNAKGVTGVRADSARYEELAVSRNIEGCVKYVEEYKATIKKEISDVDIYKMNASELNHIEMKCFYAWRRLLARIEEKEARVVTPYEKNIEFWRQLWRVIERSHVVLIIVDARDPLFYRVPDLEMYIKEVDERKEMILILNKADYLSLDHRKEWSRYFKAKGIDFVFFSTIWVNATSAHYKAKETEEDMSCRVYNVEMLIDKIHEYRKNQTEVFPELKESSNPENPAYTVGFVGYPNVGKSSLINCLMQVTKTNVSCQPGKTKHFQTLALKTANITLCDCPGLIFPNVVATKHHLLVNSIVSTSHFRGSLIFAIQLICNRIPKQLCKRYDVNIAECIIKTKDKRRVLFSQRLLESICHSRKFYSGGKGGQPDIGRAAKLVIKDYINGNLLYCAWPPTSPSFLSEVEELSDCEEEEFKMTSDMSNLKITRKDKLTVEHEHKTPHEVNLAEAKMQQWLMDKTEDIATMNEKPMTKRKLRFLIKGKRLKNYNKNN